MKKNGREGSSTPTTSGITMSTGQDSGIGNAVGNEAEDGELPVGTTSLEVRFGDDGEPFIVQLEDNETAAAIAGYAGPSNWRLPIYHYDDYDDWEVTGEYTKIGAIENTDEFREAVECNPVLEGWGNKIVLINSVE